MKICLLSEKIAIINKNEKVTYKSFARKVNIVENFLRNNNYSRVAIVMNKSCDLYALLWACYNVGSTFCCIEKNISDNAIKERLDAFKPEIVICENTNVFTNSCLVEDILLEQSNKEKTISKLKKPNDIMFVIFTSGTTGKPKGVCVLRSAFEEVITWAQNNLMLKSEDVVGQYCNVSFDMGLCDVFLSLSVGATLVIMEGISRIKPGAVIEKYGITYIYSVPTIVDIFIKNKDFEKDKLKSLRMIGFGGAALRRDQINYISKHSPHLLIYNTYGPTETTLFTSCISFKAQDYYTITKESVCLGTPISGVEYCLEENNELVVKGNHCLAGYLSENIDCENANSKMIYKTGDIVEYIEGKYYFKCRKDNQVKIHGVRIDLDGLDSFMHSKGILSSTIVVDEKLILFHTSKIHSNEEIYCLLKDYLPNNCMPNLILYISELPMNNNGKYDKVQLNNIYDERHSHYENKD